METQDIVSVGDGAVASTEAIESRLLYIGIMGDDVGPVYLPKQFRARKSRC